MAKRLIAILAASALMLGGCGGGDDDTPAGTPGADGEQTTQPADDATVQPDDDGGAQAAGDVDCSVFSGDQIATFVVWTQMFAQVRNVDGLQTMAALSFTPEQMSEILDALDQVKGIEGEVPGTAEAGLATIRKANDIYAAIIAKGDAATDADFAPLNDLEPDTASWITAQASVTDSLHQACPDLTAG